MTDSRKKRENIHHESIVEFVVEYPKANSKQIAEHFGICQRAAQKHLKLIRQKVEE